MPKTFLALLLALSSLLCAFCALGGGGMSRRRILAAVGGGGVPTALDYVQDGLVAMWDGIENAGWGVHDPASKTWVNLVDNTSFSINTKNSFTNDSMVADVDTGNNIPLYGIQDLDEYTIEVVGTTTVSGKTIVAIPFIQRGVGFLPYANWSSNSSYVIACGGNLSVQNSGPVGFVRAFGVTVNLDSYKIYSAQYDVKVVSTWAKSSNTYNGCVYAGGVLKCLRFYNHELTDSEIAANYAVDKARFNLT